MNKKEKDVSQNNETVSPKEQLGSILKNKKEDHYNFEEEVKYTVPSSSLILTSEMRGGLRPGSHRFLGNSSSGKSSCALDFMFHFLKLGTGCMGVYFDAEGRLNDEIKKRSGIKFTEDYESWEDNSCFVLKTNVYELVFGLIRELISNNPNKIKYFFIIDSINLLAKKDDMSKSFEEVNQVASGSLIASNFFQRTGAALQKRGHICIFISQIRSSIKINQYEKSDNNKQGFSTGPHVIEHAADWVMDFKARMNAKEDYFYEIPDDTKSKKIGHYCTINIIKSNHENYGQTIRYPIKYGCVDGTSVWLAKEIGDFALAWSFVKKDKNSYYFDESILTEINVNIKESIPEKFVGMTKYMNFFEERPDVTEFLRRKFSGILE